MIGHGPRQGGRLGAGLNSLSPPRGRTGFYGGVAPVAHLSQGRLCGQSARGACRSEGLVAAEHVPDRLGETAGDVDLGDLGAALFAEALLVALVAVAVDLVTAGVGGGFDQRPSAGTSAPRG